MDLTSTERRVLVALIAGAVPLGRQLSIPPDEDDVGREVGLVLSSMPPFERWGVRFMVVLLEWSVIFLQGQRFSTLNPSDRDALVLRIAESPNALVRLFARLLLTVVKPTHFARSAVQAQVGHPVDRSMEARPNPEPSWPKDRVFDALNSDVDVRCQVVVIGSGAGGGVVAAELAERGLDVVIVEAGDRVQASQLGRNPVKVLRDYYQDGATTLAFGKPSIPLPLGRTVGGTTTINSGTCFRPPEDVLDQWEKEGIRLERTHFESCLARVEERLNVQSVPEHLLGGSSSVIARGAEALGLDHGPLQRNIRGCQQAAVCAFGCPNNAKQSTNLTYVPWALEAGARLFAGTTATGLLRKGHRVGGVVARTKAGHRVTIRADAVVSACGSITGVPFLRKLGISNPHLGRHLTIHPGAKIVAQMPEAVNGWSDTPQGYGLPGLRSEGLMFEGAFVPPEYTSIALPFVGRAFTEVMEAYPHLAMFGFMVADEPVGRVWTTPWGRPFITYNLSRRDQERIQKGLGVLAEIFFAAGAERIFIPIAGREEQHSLADARRAIETSFDPIALELAAFHPLGTARMSSTARHGVVDSDLETWEIPGLYVVDGSVVPSALGVNPQITIMGFATRAADMLSDRLTN